MLPHFSLSLRILLIALLALVPAATGFAQVSFSAQEKAIVDRMVNASGQRRPSMTPDPILTLVARQRAEDMARRNYFGHVNPDGEAANWLVERAGYQLPDHYPKSKSSNNIESIAAGYDSAAKTWDGWMNSSSHKEHLLANTSFFQSQTSYGVGYHYSASSKYKHYWVVLTAPPSARPQLEIASPSANQAVSVPQVALSGKTGGNPAAASVQYRVENAAGVSGYRSASGVAQWNATATDLEPGANTVRVRSLDGSGAVLAEASLVVRYVVLQPLTVSVTGEGTVANGFLGTTMREEGRPYTASAVAARGWLFAGWTGSISGTKANLSFVMREGLSLTAHFIPNPFLGSDGVYMGLLGGNAGSHANSGMLRVKLTGTGAFTGKVFLGGSTHTVKGRLQVDGTATVTIPRPDGSALTLTLQLDPGGSGAISGSLSDGAFSSALNARRAEGQNAFAGRYTVSLPAAGSAGAAVLQGHGFATLIVTPEGKAKLAGSLADGQPFVRAGFISSTGELPLYVPLYFGKGALIGEVRFRETAAAHLDGAMRWFKPSTNDASSQLVEMPAPLIGSRYNPPAPGDSVFEVSPVENNATLFLGDGNLLDPIEQPATLADGNRVILPEPAVKGLALNIKPQTGHFSGKFIHPVTGAKSKFRGVIFQKQNAGYGYFLGADRSGYTSFVPAR